MAKFTPGPMIAAASGSQGGTVFSHNRGGMYTRNRSVPVVSTTTFALAAKSRLATESAAWAGLTAVQRGNWNAYALQRPTIDTLGFPRFLSGLQQFVSVNTRLVLAGFARLTAPPITTSPDGLASIILSADIGAGTVSVAFTPTPTSATEHIWVWSAVTNSAGISFVQNLLRYTGVSAGAQASPFDIEALVVTRHGTLVVGQTLHVLVHIFDEVTGLVSRPLRDQAVVITT